MARAPRQEGVGPPHHGVLFVQDGRHAQDLPRQHRRHGGVAAESHDGGWVDPLDLPGGDPEATPEGEERGSALDQGAAGRCRRRDSDDLGGREAGGDGIHPGIGGQHDPHAPGAQGVCQALGGEQVATRAAGTEQDRGCRDRQRITPAMVAGAVPGGFWLRVVVRGRLRVKATRKPMPSASEISEEPP